MSQVSELSFIGNTPGLEILNLIDNIMKRIEWALIVILALTFASCRHAANKPDAADFIYFGGDIIRMEGDSAQYAEAIAVKNGKIVFVGSKEAAENMKGDSTVLNDLPVSYTHLTLPTKRIV